MQSDVQLLAGRLTPSAKFTRRNIALVITYLVVFALLWHGHATNLLDDFLAVGLALTSGLFMVAVPVLDPIAFELPMAPLIALVGCDGSGKTTLSADLMATFSAEGRVSTCYLGLGSGALGEKLKTFPIIGPLLEQKLARKAKQTRTKGEKIPGGATAIVVYGFSLLRLRRFRRMLRRRRNGVAIITDRYPQVEVAGFYDGPGLSAGRPGSRFVAMLAHRESRMYAWMASFHPTVVIRLNVDADTAHARKPDHTYQLLQQKVDATAQLSFSGAPIIDLDSRQPYVAVRSAAERIAWRTFHPRAECQGPNDDLMHRLGEDRLGTAAASEQHQIA